MRKHKTDIVRVIFMIMLLILQMILLAVLPFWLEHHAVFVYLLIEVLGIIVILPLAGEERDASYKVFWLMVVLLLPISGHVIYELWGKDEGKLKKHTEAQETINWYTKHKIVDENLQRRISEENIQNGRISQYLCKNGYPAYDASELAYFATREELFEALLDDLKKAKRYIFLSSFTIKEGKLWDAIRFVLMDKAKQGVEVRVIYDDVGTLFHLTEQSIKDLIAAGVEIHQFNAMEKNLWMKYYHHRSHHRIVAIDGEVAYTGGINIRDQYPLVWKDGAVRVFGEAALGFSLIFLGMWDPAKEVSHIDTYKSAVLSSTRDVCQPFAAGPLDNPDNPTRDIYHLMANTAMKELCITTPYLVLDAETMSSLCTAAKSGIEVKIIAPSKWDRKVEGLLTRYSYGQLLKNGAKIYEYQPGFVHTKMCFNENCGMIGTGNMNFRSFYLHYECGIWMKESQCLADMRADFADTQKQCKEITLQEWKNRSFGEKMLQNLLQVVKCHF